MIKNYRVVVFFVLFSTFVGACQKEEPHQIVATVKSKLLNMEVDTRFSVEQSKIIQSAFDRFDSLEFNEKSTWDTMVYFEEMFGGQTIQDVANFINKRIKYFVYVNDALLQLQYKDQAFKIGASYSMSWMEYLCSKDDESYVYVNGKKVSINTSRHGVMLSGPAFFNSYLSDIERISIFVHEARHADCSTKPDSLQSCSIIKDFQTSDELLECGYRHSKCNEEDTLLGCDSISWGAYAVSQLITSKIYADCTNCTEMERQIALTLANSMYSRFRFDTPGKSQFSGSPDLSSYDE